MPQKPDCGVSGIIFVSINEHLKKVHKKIGQQPEKELYGSGSLPLLHT